MIIYYLTSSDMMQLPPGEMNSVEDLISVGFNIQITNWRRLNLEGVKTDDLIILRSTWDYQQYLSEFISFLNSIKQLQLHCINDVDTMIWNLNKRYMLQFMEMELNVIPTFEDSEIEICLQKFPIANQFIAKPIYSAGARGLKKLSRKELRFTNLKNHIIQPFFESIISNGEWSLIYYNGEYSHAILKKAKIGDFRVQHDYGGTYQRIEVDESWKELGKTYLNVLPQKPIFARVDLILYNDNPHLIELELVEPELFLDKKNEQKRYTEIIDYFIRNHSPR